MSGDGYDEEENICEEASGGGGWDDEEYLAAYFFSWFSLQLSNPKHIRFLWFLRNMNNQR